MPNLKMNPLSAICFYEIVFYCKLVKEKPLSSLLRLIFSLSNRFYISFLHRKLAFVSVIDELYRCSEGLFSDLIPTAQP